MGTKHAGVRAASESTIEIDFYYQNIRCRERISLKPTPTNLKKAAQHRAAILNAIEAGTFDYSFTFPNSKNAHKFAPSHYTVKKYLTEWLDNKKPILKASTHLDYRKTFINIIIPRFGMMLLHQISRNDVRQWIATLDCSNKRISNILSPLRAALQDAQHDDLIPVNPLYNWTYKRNEAPNKISHVDPFTREEQQAIINAAVDVIRNQIITFFWTGMRTSELIALEWSDIDWKRKKISVNKAITTAGRTDETTKTKSGKREVDILPPVEKALIDQKGYSLLKGGKVFLNPSTGKQWAGDQQIRKGYWISILEKAGVRYRNPYQTRHTYASMMLSAGENLAWVSHQMGHSDVLITARTYARWIQSDEQQGLKAMNMFGQHIVSDKK